jgi:hypothetical protein
MRWFKRSVVLCVLALVLTPARADAWFEWLDYLSGPGRWYGYKVDLRLWCSGPKGDWKGLRGVLDQAIAESLSPKPDIRRAAAPKWQEVLENLKKSYRALPLIDPATFASDIEGVRSALGLNQLGTEINLELAPLAVVKMGEDLHRVLDVFERGAASIASTGILLSLCKNDRTRAFAVEIGFSSAQANSNPAYAGDHSIRMNTLNAGLSYRLPLPPKIDIVDVGANVGMYHFSSRGFKSFSGLMVEPVFIDLHGPTKLVQAAGLEQLLALVTVRLSLIYFPAGFDGAQFASVASKPARISGRDATRSVTVFFNLTPLLWHRPKSTVAKLAAGMQ